VRPRDPDRHGAAPQQGERRAAEQVAGERRALARAHDDQVAARALDVGENRLVRTSDRDLGRRVDSGGAGRLCGGFEELRGAGRDRRAAGAVLAADDLLGERIEVERRQQVQLRVELLRQIGRLIEGRPACRPEPSAVDETVGSREVDSGRDAGEGAHAPTLYEVDPSSPPLTTSPERLGSTPSSAPRGRGRGSEEPR